MTDFAFWAAISLTLIGFGLGLHSQIVLAVGIGVGVGWAVYEIKRAVRQSWRERR